MHDALRARRDVRLLFGGQFVSDLGGQLTIFALPAIAIVSLHATALQVGGLQAFEFAVVPLLATLAGVIADRHPRKPLMIGANVTRMVALASIPIAWALHALTLGQFFAVGAVCAGASVLFDTAYAAFLPNIFGRDQHHRSVGRMALSGSAAEALGSSTSGAIVQCAGGPLAVLFDVFACMLSTFALVRVRDVERVDQAESGAATLADAAAGFALVARDPILRAVALSSSTAYLGGAMVTSVFALYCYRGLHLSPVQLGLVMGLANLGLIGAAFARRIGERLGPRRTLVGATVLSAIGKFVFLVHAAPLVAVLIGRLLLSLSGPIASTTQQALQTTRAPDAVLGRMNAAMRTIIWGALPLGSLLGGAVATWRDVPAAIALGATISLTATLWLATCPALSRRRLAAKPAEVLSPAA